jgi:hypothetical protein
VQVLQQIIAGTEVGRPLSGQEVGEFASQLSQLVRSGDLSEQDAAMMMQRIWVVVTKLDRLGRSTRELLDLIHRIDQAGASFKSLGDPLFDTTSSQGRLLVTMLAAIAEFERELIRERTSEGRKRAKANGVRFGRKPKLTLHQRTEALRRRSAGETLATIARTYNVSVSMISAGSSLARKLGRADTRGTSARTGSLF